MSPHEQMLRLISGYWISQAVYVAAKLGLADLVKDSPRSADELAAATKTHAPSLYRLLRALASVGVFAEDAQHRFGLTPMAECLRSDLPGSQRGLAVMNGEEHYRAYGELLYSVQTGKTGFEHLYGMGVFDYLTQHPEQARTFDEAMVGVHETAASPSSRSCCPMRTEHSRAVPYRDNLPGRETHRADRRRFSNGSLFSAESGATGPPRRETTPRPTTAPPSDHPRAPAGCPGQRRGSPRHPPRCPG